MYLTKIIIQNFQSYYDKSEINLQKNLNLVLGTIGVGKSKLFNAFYWNFYNEIYKTQHGWINIGSLNFLSVFNKMKLKEAEENEIVKALVELHIVSDKKYIVSHYIDIQRINNDDFTSEKNWKFINEELIISFDNNDGNRVNIDNRFEAQKYVDKKLLPKDISKYIWFQGETLNELIDIKNGKTFRNAIYFISYIGYYDKSIEIVETLIAKIEKLLRKEKKKDTSNEKQFVQISNEIERLERQLPSFEENIANKKNELNEINKAIEDIDKRLDDIDEFIDLKNKKDNLDRDRKDIFRDIENQEKEKSNQFSKSWVLLNTDTLIKSGFTKLQSYQKWFEEKQNNNPTGLPYDVPSPSFLKDMLDDLKCFICGEPFDKNSDAYHNIEKRMKIANGKIEEFRKENSENLMLNNKLVELLSHQTSLLTKVNKVNPDIKEYLEKNAELNKNKIEIISAIREIDDNITFLQEKHGNKIIDNFSIEKNNYNYNINERDNINITIRHLEEKAYKLNQELKQKKEELNKIPTKTDIKYKEEEVLSYLYFLNETYKKTKEIEFDKLITKIENKANEILTKTTKANVVINGKIQIDRNSYIIKLIDLDDENDNRDINVGHFVLMKMCIINAIVLTSNEYQNKSYPFISDAPTSDLDDGTTKLYYKVLNEEFEQSIIMSKDLHTYKDGKNIFEKSSVNEFNFKNVYIIEKGGATEKLTETNSYSNLTKII